MMYSQSPKRLYFLNLVALIGWVFSIILSEHYYTVRNGSEHFRSSCNIGQTFNCDVIAASSYSELFAGLPLSSFGAGWFLGIFIISVIAHSVFWRRESTRALLGMSMAGVLVSLYYFAVMALRLKTFCLFCLGVDAMAVAALGLTLSLRPEGFREHPWEPSKWKVFAFTVLGSLLAMTIGLRGLDQSTSSEGSLESAERILSSPVERIPEEGLSSVIGPQNAPITIVEFSDFQCPYCRLGALSLNTVFNRYPGKIKVIFRHFPLDQSCNSEVQSTAHPAACEAAQIAHCAHQQGRFDIVYETLFEKQSQLQAGHVLHLIQPIPGLQMSTLEACMNSPETQVKISQDIQAGKQLKVEGTPTFFINGHRIVGILPPQDWYKIIDALIKTQSL